MAHFVILVKTEWLVMLLLFLSPIVCLFVCSCWLFHRLVLAILYTLSWLQYDLWYLICCFGMISATFPRRTSDFCRRMGIFVRIGLWNHAAINWWKVPILDILPSFKSQWLSYNSRRHWRLVRSPSWWYLGFFAWILERLMPFPGFNSRCRHHLVL